MVHNRAMTDEPNRPQPGWYADPQSPGELRYWDGEAWGQQFKSSAKSPRGPRPVGRGFTRLGGVLGFLLVLALLILVAQFALYVWCFVVIDDAVESGDVDMITTFDDMDRVLSVGVVLAVIVAGICWMFWQHRVARAIPGLERSPAMHAFSWIIPIAWFWLPFQNVRAVWRRCVRGRGTATVAWWWTGWLVAGFIGRVTSGAAESTDTVSGLRSVLFFAAAGALIGVVTAVLAIRIVRLVTAAASSGEFVEYVPPLRPEGLPDAW